MCRLLLAPFTDPRCSVGLSAGSEPNRPINPTSNHAASLLVLFGSPWSWLLTGYRHRWLQAHAIGSGLHSPNMIRARSRIASSSESNLTSDATWDCPTLPILLGLR